ncbi:MAG: hypothetical protein MAG431_01876 [Chloroflexi bacterium]|nr:hypothetical protein [Chloroflexota bacterium]
MFKGSLGYWFWLLITFYQSFPFCQSNLGFIEFKEFYEKATVIKKQINALIAYLYSSRSNKISEPPASYQIHLPDHSDY